MYFIKSNSNIKINADECIKAWFQSRLAKPNLIWACSCNFKVTYADLHFQSIHHLFVSFRLKQ